MLTSVTFLLRLRFGLDVSLLIVFIKPQEVTGQTDNSSQIQSIIITSFARSYSVVIAFSPISRSLFNIFLKKLLELRDISLLNINI